MRTDACAVVQPSSRSSPSDAEGDAGCAEPRDEVHPEAVHEYVWLIERPKVAVRPALVARREAPLRERSLGVRSSEAKPEAVRPLYVRNDSSDDREEAADADMARADGESARQLDFSSQGSTEYIEPLRPVLSRRCDWLPPARVCADCPPVHATDCKDMC